MLGKKLSSVHCSTHFLWQWESWLALLTIELRFIKLTTYNKSIVFHPFFTISKGKKENRKVVGAEGEQARSGSGAVQRGPASGTVQCRRGQARPGSGVLSSTQRSLILCAITEHHWSHSLTICMTFVLAWLRMAPHAQIFELLVNRGLEEFNSVALLDGWFLRLLKPMPGPVSQLSGQEVALSYFSRTTCRHCHYGDDGLNFWPCKQAPS